MKLSRTLPLNALRVFEAAARIGSFTRAGDELGMTQTAVSYQIRLLEEHIGEPLFLRRPRQVVLTETGERLAPKLAQAFALMSEAVASARSESDEILHVHSTPTFAQQWLASRLGTFQIRHPRIAVRLATSGTIVDFSREPADVAIRWGRGDWPGLLAHRIMRLDFSPMLSPTLLASSGGLSRPADLLHLPIISAGDRWWRIWFAAAGVEMAAVEALPQSEFGTQSIDAAMAIAGQGVAIVNPEHFRDDVAAGRLVQPFALSAHDGRDYWLVYPENRRNAPKIRAFRTWMLEEIARAT
ncbi:LysR substrate-binding domain-containing protein [Ensifer soli]|uniref:LysR substrate-binding domain-containing protein n=1 Tax=Ciceribacter sp. sgz301302 TaxID=3342379 RepID=UPI0035B9D196